jgi:hypothetical protein
MLHALRRLSPQPKRTIAIATILAIGMLAAMITAWVAAPVEAKPTLRSRRSLRPRSKEPPRARR